MSKVLQMSLPLKDIRVRGDLLENIQIHEENNKIIHREMMKMRQDFSTIQFNVQGDTVSLVHWQAGKHQPYSAPQLRWRFKVSGISVPIPVTSPIVHFLQLDTKNSKIIRTAIWQLSKLEAYFKIFLEFEIARVKINAESKVNAKTLEVLDDLHSSIFNVESSLGQLLIDN